MPFPWDERKTNKSGFIGGRLYMSDGFVNKETRSPATWITMVWSDGVCIGSVWEAEHHVKRSRGSLPYPHSIIKPSYLFSTGPQHLSTRVKHARLCRPNSHRQGTD